MSTIEYVDQTCRDGQQSLWGMQMRAGHILPVAEQIEAAGYRVVDLTGSGMFNVLTRFHQENPWKGLDRLREAMPNPIFRFGKRSNGLSGMGVANDAIIELYMKTMANHGVGSVWIFDCLHDVPKMRETARTARRVGLAPSLQINFSESPIHTDEYYAKVMTELAAETAVESLILGDEAGVLGTERACTWIPLMKELAGDKALEMHFHDSTGQAAMNHAIGVEAGVTILHTAVRGLANGVSMPSAQVSVDNMARLGHSPAIDPSVLDPISDHLEGIARMEGYTIGAPVEYNLATIKSQIPGGMMGTLRDQLEREGMLHFLPQLQEEAVQVRAEMGYPIMATPYSQLIGIQALLNVVEGERYKVIPDENLMYCAGWYGEPPAPIADFILERAWSTKRGREIRDSEPPQQTIEEMREQFGGPHLSDEELLLRFMINPSFVEAMLAAERPIEPIYPLSADLELAVGLIKNSSARSLNATFNDVEVELRRS
jgi:oxaloacetate decarboxylase alpha subunit